MKQTIKSILRILTGVCIGLVIVCVCLVIFTDISADELFGLLNDLTIFRVLYVAIMMLISLILSIFLQTILHEGGHLSGGLVTGYKFVSFRVFDLTLIRENGHFRIKRFNIGGTGGQCLLSPPDVAYEEMPYFWYNAGGVLMNLFTAIIASVGWLYSVVTFVDIFLLYFFLCGFFFAFLNGIPMKIGGITNDAYNIVLMRKDISTRKYLAQQLAINAEIQKGIRLKDIPTDWFSEEEVTDYNNTLQISARIAYASRCMELRDFETAYACLGDLMRHSAEMPSLFVKEIACELLFLELMTTCRKEEIERFYTPDLQKYISQYKQVMSSKQRLLCALALFWDKDRTKAQAIYEELFLKQGQYLMQGEVIFDLEIMRCLLDNKTL